MEGPTPQTLLPSNHTLYFVRTDTGVVARLTQESNQNSPNVGECSLNLPPDREWTYEALCKSEYTSEIQKINTFLSESKVFPIGYMSHSYVEAKNIGLMAVAPVHINSLTQNFQILPPSNESQQVPGERSIKNMLYEAIIEAAALKQYFEKREVEKAKQSARVLCKMGTGFIKAELKGESWIPDSETPHPIIKDICAAIREPGFITFESLQKKAAKALRIFVELTWYQVWRIYARERRVLLSEVFKQDLLNVSKFSDSILKDQVGKVDIVFEHRCSKKAAKCIVPALPVMRKFIVLAAQQADAEEGKGVNGTWIALKTLVQALQDECPFSWRKYFWYHNVHILRWDVIGVQTMEDYESRIAPKISLYHEKGGNYSICLTKVFWELVKRDDVHEGVKRRAFFGTDQHPGLRHVVLWEHEKSLSSYRKHPLEAVGSLVFRTADRFLDSRKLAIRYLKKICVNDTGRLDLFKPDSQKALKQRREHLENNTSRRVEQEQAALKAVIATIDAEIEALEERAARTGTVMSLLDSSRSGGSTELENEELQAFEDETTHIEDQLLRASKGIVDEVELNEDEAESLQGLTEQAKVFLRAARENQGKIRVDEKSAAALKQVNTCLESRLAQYETKKVTYQELFDRAESLVSQLYQEELTLLNDL